MRYFPLKFIAAILVCVPLSVLQAQDRWRLEILPGVAHATQNMADTSLGTGLGLEGNLSYRFLPHLAAYGGWDCYQFRTDLSFAGPDTDVEETGYAFGLRFEHPIHGSTSPSLVLRAGGTYNHIELEDSSGNITFDSEHGLGWEAGAGLGFPLGEHWQFTPGVRFRSTSREFNAYNVRIPANLRYVTFEAGISRSF